MLNLDWKPPTLETDRLILRPVDENDLAAVFLYASNPNVSCFTLFTTHQTIDDTLFYLRDYRVSRYATGEPDPIGVVLKSDPTRSVIGAIGCHWIARPDGVMELGYAIAEPYWGRGIVGEAAWRLLQFVFAEYPVERMQARVIGGNEASCRVAEKLGLTREGTLRSIQVVKGRRIDLVYYSILRSEFEARNHLTSRPQA